MFKVLLKMGMAKKFVDAKTIICLNGSITKTFEINKGVQ
jgi:hypothetical protein